MTIALLTHGWVCYRDISVINRHVLPYNLTIKDQSIIDLQIKEVPRLTLNICDIVDKQLNLKLDQSQINIKKDIDSQINLRT